MYEPGDSVFVIERTPEGKPVQVCGYMFIAFAYGYAICSTFMSQIHDVKSIMKHKAKETAEAFDTSFSVFNLNDLYPSYEIAVKAMNIEVCTKK